LNGVLLSLYEKGNETAFVDYLITTWSNISWSNAYEMWPEGPILALFNEPGMVNTAPERALLTRIIGDIGGVVYRNFSFGTTNVDTGEYQTFR